MAIWYAAPVATGTGSGVDENNADTLAGAALSASALDDIYCDVGTYAGILIPADVTVWGGFDFSAFVADPTLRDLANNVSVIDLGSGPGFTVTGTGAVIDGWRSDRSTNAANNAVYVNSTQSATVRNYRANVGTNSYTYDFHVRDSATLTVENCQISSGNAAAIYCSDSGNLFLNQCLFIPAWLAGYTVRVRSSATGTLENCIFWGQTGMLELVTGTITYSIIEGGFTGTGNLNSDPLWVNPAGGDYELQALSPAIGAANSGTALSIDRLLRTRDGSPDMGPLERIGGGPVAVHSPLFFGGM